MPVTYMHDDDELSAAELYHLMTGGLPPWRAHEWVALCQRGRAGEQQHLKERWQRHRAELIAVAAAHQFVPFFECGRRPKGPGFKQWARSLRAMSEY